MTLSTYDQVLQMTKGIDAQTYVDQERGVRCSVR